MCDEETACIEATRLKRWALVAPDPLSALLCMVRDARWLRYRHQRLRVFRETFVRVRKFLVQKNDVIATFATYLSLSSAETPLRAPLRLATGAWGWAAPRP